MPDNDHQHGGDPAKVFERLGLPPVPVLDFSVNVSPLGVPEQVLGQWESLADEIVHYPSVDGGGVRRFYQERYQLPAATILPGNGSIELIYLVPRVLALKRVAALMPGFNDYQRASLLAGAEVVPLFLSSENGFAAPGINELEAVLSESDALFLGNPNNPTGTVFDPRMLQELAAGFPNKYILVDEAFVQFLDQHQETTLMHEGRLAPNILVFSSLTKFYALAGIRLGAVISHPDIIAKLGRFKEPWTVNRVGERIAAILIQCKDYEERLRALIRTERERVAAEMAEIKEIKLFPGTANFFLAQWTATRNLDDLIHSLLAKGLYLRDCRNFPGLEENYFRFALRRPEDNRRLLSSIRQWRS